MEYNKIIIGFVVHSYRDGECVRQEFKCEAENDPFPIHLDWPDSDSSVHNNGSNDGACRRERDKKRPNQTRSLPHDEEPGDTIPQPSSIYSDYRSQRPWLTPPWM